MEAREEAMARREAAIVRREAAIVRREAEVVEASDLLDRKEAVLNDAEDRANVQMLTSRIAQLVEMLRIKEDELTALKAEVEEMRDRNREL